MKQLKFKVIYTSLIYLQMYTYYERAYNLICAYSFYITYDKRTVIKLKEIDV